MRESGDGGARRPHSRGGPPQECATRKKKKNTLACTFPPVVLSTLHLMFSGRSLRPSARTTAPTRRGGRAGTPRVPRASLGDIADVAAANLPTALAGLGALGVGAAALFVADPERR